MSFYQTIIDYIKGSQPAMRYVTTVILNSDLSNILVIRKTKGPANLVGKLNGVGGKIEPGEGIFDAALREIAEESALILDKDQLQFIGNLSNKDYTWDVAVFMAVLTDDELAKFKTLTEEQVELWPVGKFLMSAESDVDFKHMVYEALRLASKQQLYNGLRGFKFNSIGRA